MRFGIRSETVKHTDTGKGGVLVTGKVRLTQMVRAAG